MLTCPCGSWIYSSTSCARKDALARRHNAKRLAADRPACCWLARACSVDQVRAVRSPVRSLAPLDGEPAAAPSARVRQPASLLDRRLLDSHRLNSRVVPPRLPPPAAHAPVAAAAAATMPQSPREKGKEKGKRKSGKGKKQRKEEAKDKKKVAEQEAIATMCKLINGDERDDQENGMTWAKEDGTVPTLRQGECALCVAAASRDALADAPADAHTRAGHLIAGLLPLARVRPQRKRLRRPSLADCLAEKQRRSRPGPTPTTRAKKVSHARATRAQLCSARASGACARAYSTGARADV
jgi:hypothetical protein